MPKKNIPSYRLHKPTGQGIVVLCGKTHYLGKHKSKASREKYNLLIADYLANGEKMPPLRYQKEITVEELAVKFLEWAETYYLDEDGKKTMTVEHCRLALSPLVRHYGNNAVSQFGPLSLKFVRDKLIAEDLVRSTINSRINIIRQAFRWGVENEMVPSDVWRALDAVANLKKGRSAARDNDKIPPVPDTVVDKTLFFLSEIVSDMVNLQRCTGGRPEDVCNMRAGDIEQIGDVWTYRPYRHKTKHKGKNRSLAIGPRAQKILLPYLTRKKGDEFIFSPTDAVKQLRDKQKRSRKSKVPPSQIDRSKILPERKPGQRYTTHSYRRAIHRACDKAGIERWNPNQIRHLTGTKIAAKFNQEASKEYLGHASVRTTEQFYIAPLPELAVKVAREMG